MVKKKSPPARRRAPQKVERSVTRGAAAAVLTLMVLFLAVRWNTFAAPFERDEGEYAYAAWLMGQGILPYKNAFMQKPPMVIYTYLAGQAASGGVWPPRVLAALFLAGAVACTALFARRELGTSGAFASAALAIPMLALPELAPFAANTEVFMLLPLAATLAVYGRGRGRSGDAAWFAAGALAAGALLYKPICLFVLAVLAGLWIYETWRDSRSVTTVARRVAAGLAGGAAAALAALGWFLARDGGRSFWEAAVRFNAYYARLGEEGRAFLAQIQLLWSQWWALFALFGWFVFRRPKRLWFYAALVVAAWLGVYRSWNLHYVLLVVPFLALLGAAAIEGIADYCELGSWRYGVVAVVAGVLALPGLRLIGMAPDAIARSIYGSANPFVESEEVARRVAELTRPEDFVYVAGSEPQILYHARRRSPTRFVISYPLMLETPLALPYQQECVRDLERNPPAAIVFARSPLSWLPRPNSPKILMDYLGRTLQSDYRLVGGFVPDAVRGAWEEPIPSDHHERASLLVFQRSAAHAKPGH
jgi:hypothetical protein